MKIDFNITKMVEEITMQAKENTEEFIIETIHPYCENVLQLKISKEELKQILLNGMQKHGPCNDCIGRAAAIKTALPYVDGDLIADELKHLPSVTPKAEWIPVSERLPEIHQDVLLSLRSLEVLTGFRAAGTEPYFYCQGDYIEHQNVLAWMPLPEPYKESEE